MCKNVIKNKNPTMLIHVLLMSSRDLGKFDIPQTEIPARTKKTGSLLAKFYTTFARCGS